MLLMKLLATVHEAAAQMYDAYVDDSSVLDQAVTEDDEGIKDVDNSSISDELHEVSVLLQEEML